MGNLGNFDARYRERRDRPSTCAFGTPHKPREPVAAWWICASAEGEESKREGQDLVELVRVTELGGAWPSREA